jgi:hypothetical protein
LIKQVYEVDPLFCPKCGGEMKIISFIERRQSEVIEKILRHCGLWDETPARAPPAGEWLWAEDQLKELRTGCWRGFLEILRGTWRLAFRPERVISTPKPPDSLLLLLSGLEMTENLR